MVRSMPTIKDIAALAGVSISTVSAALNQRDGVSEGTRLRVEEAARRLGYRPSLIARAMVTGRTYTLGLLIDDITNPYFADVILATEQAAARRGYGLLLCNVLRGFRQPEAALELLASRQVDGIIVMTYALDPQAIARVHRDGIPVVQWEIPPAPDSGIPLLQADLAAGERAAMAHLLSLGHKRIAFIGGIPQYFAMDRRYHAYRAALDEAGLDPDPSLALPGDYKIEGGRKAARHLLRLKTPPTAIVTVSDATAVGVIHAVRSAGLRVPEDISVVGFDDILLASVIDPPLTTVAIPRFQVGAQAVRLVTRQIEHKACPRTVTLPTSLIVRGSTAPPRS